MFKLTKISIELAVLLLLSAFVFLYVILTRYFALALLLTAIVVTYKLAMNHHLTNKAVAIAKEHYRKSLPEPPDKLPAPPDSPLPTLEQQVEKFRQELNQD